MEFRKALNLMKKGEKLKLPSWGGYWYWDAEKQTVIMHTKDSEELDIRETQRVEYTLSNVCSDEWIIANKQNCPELGGEATFNFSEALKYLNRGFKVRRKEWNDLLQYIWLQDKTIIVSYVGDVNINWTTLYSDMLAEDWMFVD